MDARRRRQRVLLSALSVVLVAVLAYQYWPEGERSASNAVRAARPAQPGATRPAPRGARGANVHVDAPQVVDVEVGRLEQPLPTVESGGRNPFGFRPKAPPPPPPRDEPRRPPQNATASATDPTGPAGTAPPPPIALKFIGTLTGQIRTGKVAILSDGKFVYYGREGDIIEGRYRVVKIGDESVQMEYVDGRGRQTIRLSGA
jgi:hypothetical protein